MRVKVLFFGMLKDIVGSAEEQLNVPEDAQLENIFDHYAGRYPRLREMAGSIVLARTRHPIDTRAIIQRLVAGEDGAVITFEGTVRNNTKGRGTLYLDYECYEAMAIKTLAEIGREIAGSHAI